MKKKYSLNTTNHTNSTNSNITNQLIYPSDSENANIINSKMIQTKKKFLSQKKIIFNKKGFPKLNIPPDEEKTFIEFVLGDFHDFNKIKDVPSYKKMTCFSVINEFLETPFDIIEKIPFKENLVYLCLNQNLLSNLNGIDLCVNLEELQLNFNKLTEIPVFLKDFKNLKKIWMCDNNIKTIKNIPNVIENLWLANNLIEKIPSVFVEYKNLNFLNLSGNCINDLIDLYNLEKNKKLEKLYLNDVNFNDNPICNFIGYRNFMIHFFPNVKVLDQTFVSEEERKEVENYFGKKNLFYKNKIRNGHKLSKMLFQFLKTHKMFVNNMKLIQINFFSMRKKMLEFILFEKKINKNKTNENNEIKDIENEIKLSEDKIKICVNYINNIDNNFIYLKNFISNLNDLGIVFNFYELESGGNIKIESGNILLKWVKSCLDLMKIKINPEFFNKNNIKNIKFLKSFKLLNKKTKILFDSIYEKLVDNFGLFGNEKKFFDFYFLMLPVEKNVDYKKLFEILIDKNDEIEMILTDNFSVFDEFYIKKGFNHFVGIICKCANFENMFEYVNEKEKNNVNFKEDNFNCYEDLLNYMKEYKKEKDIIKMSINDNNFFYYKIKGIVMPEYIIEYEYDLNNNNNSNVNNYFFSSFSSKISLPGKYENLFNKCSKDFYYFNNNNNNNNNNFHSFFFKEDIDKYSLSKFSEFSELENGLLFFCKKFNFKFHFKLF